MENTGLIMQSQDLVAAVDLGGTFTKVALIDGEGTVRAEGRLQTKLSAMTDADGGAGTVEWLADQLAAFIKERAQELAVDVVAYGVAVPGIVDTEAGVVVAAANIGWYGVDLAGPLSDRLGIPGKIGHDVRTAGLAEWQVGAGRGVSNLLFVPLGTGIAAAAVVDGRMLSADGYAGELGHIAVPAAGDQRCACGALGCLEIVASAAGVARSYRQFTAAGTATGTAAAESAEQVTAEQVAERARAGEPAAVAAFDRAGLALSEAFVIALTLLGPERIVIGGGLSGAADLLLPRIEKEFDRRLAFQRRPELTRSSFGSRAGVIGAGLLGRSSIAEPDDHQLRADLEG